MLKFIKTGDLVRVHGHNGPTINVITKIEKRRNHYGTHDIYANVFGCDSEFFHEKDMVLISASR